MMERRLSIPTGIRIGVPNKTQLSTLAHRVDLRDSVCSQLRQRGTQLEHAHGIHKKHTHAHTQTHAHIYTRARTHTYTHAHARTH